MSTQPGLAEMSLDDLRDLIGSMIDERLGNQEVYQIGQRSIEVWQSIRDNVVQRPSGTPTPTELLYQEREKWRQDT